MGLVTKDDGWRLSDKLWKENEPLLPSRKGHPLGCHNPRVPDRNAMNASLFVLRTGCQWNALDAFWRTGLVKYDGLKGIDWSWLSMDGAMTKAPVAGSKNPDRTRRIEANKASSAAC